VNAIGAPEVSPDNVNATGLRVAIVAGSWHPHISEGLVEGAIRFLDRCGASWELFRVAGSFELPLVSKVALESGFDAAVALGVIIQGDTPHFEYVAQAATDGLTKVALDTGKPVGFGVLTLDTIEQGLDRAGFADSSEDKGAEASDAAVRTALITRSLHG
jgi:6,7-dimethyl-8-ribityllumazine synthase